MTLFLYIFLYIMIASGAIFGLLVAADKWTELEKPAGYVVCGIFWPVAVLPAAAYLAAAWYINRGGRETDGEE